MSSTLTLKGTDDKTALLGLHHIDNSARKDLSLQPVEITSYASLK